jgi:hypothetical protein
MATFNVESRNAYPSFTRFHNRALMPVPSFVCV